MQGGPARYHRRSAAGLPGSFLLSLILDEELGIVNSLGKEPMAVPILRHAGRWWPVQGERSKRCDFGQCHVRFVPRAFANAFSCQSGKPWRMVARMATGLGCLRQERPARVVGRRMWEGSTPQGGMAMGGGVVPGGAELCLEELCLEKLCLEELCLEELCLEEWRWHGLLLACWC